MFVFDRGLSYNVPMSSKETLAEYVWEPLDYCIMISCV